jgi:hypothetical protein
MNFNDPEKTNDEQSLNEGKTTTKNSAHSF